MVPQAPLRAPAKKPDQNQKALLWSISLFELGFTIKDEDELDEKIIKSKSNDYILSKHHKDTHYTEKNCEDSF